MAGALRPAPAPAHRRRSLRGRRTPLLINSSHHGAINDLAYDAQRRLLFSGGDDGTVRVWSHDRRTIIRNLRVGAARVVSIAVHPEDTLVAVVLRPPGSDDLLEVWDWHAGRRRYRHELEDAPLHVGFTSRGSSLVYTRARFDSVVFLDPRTGRRQRRLPVAFGIVSYVTTSTNERTIMTYQPTGEVRYWDAETEELKAALPTLANLEEISVSADRSLLMARTGDEMVAIDVITGAVRYRFPVSRRSLFTVADRLPQVAVLRPAGPEEPGSTLRRFTLDRAVTASSESSLELNGSVTAAVYAGRDLFLADRSAIWEVGPSGAQPFVRDELLAPVAFAAGGDTLLVATARRIAVARLQRPQAAATPGFGEPTGVPGARPQLADANLLRNPFGVAVGMAVIYPGELPAVAAPAGVARPPNPDGVVLVWNREGPSGRLGTIDPRTGRYRLRLTNLPTPLIPGQSGRRTSAPARRHRKHHPLPGRTAPHRLGFFRTGTGAAVLGARRQRGGAGRATPDCRPAQRGRDDHAAVEDRHRQCRNPAGSR